MKEYEQRRIIRRSYIQYSYITCSLLFFFILFLYAYVAAAELQFQEEIAGLQCKAMCRTAYGVTTATADMRTARGNSVRCECKTYQREDDRELGYTIKYVNAYIPF